MDLRRNKKESLKEPQRKRTNNKFVRLNFYRVHKIRLSKKNYKEGFTHITWKVAIPSPRAELPILHGVDIYKINYLIHKYVQQSGHACQI